MPSIGFDTTAMFGQKVQQSIQALTLAKYTLARTKVVMDGLTAGGASPSNLEISVNGTVPATAGMFKVVNGQGANFYNAIVSINSAIGALQAVIDLDQG